MRTLLKAAGIALGVLAVLVVAVFALSTRIVDRTYDVEPEAIAVTADSAQLAWGATLARTHGCQSCHGERLEGQVFADAPPFRLVAGNLTAGAGGVGADYTTADWVRAIRHGVAPDGRGLWMMPSQDYRYFHEGDLTALVSYLQTLPPVDNPLPETELRPLGRVIAVASRDFRPAPDLMDDDGPLAAVIPVSADAAYGRYRATVVCASCHGRDLMGGKHPAPDGPEAPALGASGQWSRDAFFLAMRTGVTPSGDTLSHWMPWKEFKYMPDDELDALHQHLRTLVGAPATASVR